jgi:hypothetical protein
LSVPVAARGRYEFRYSHCISIAGLATSIPAQQLDRCTFEQMLRQRTLEKTTAALSRIFRVRGRCSEWRNALNQSLVVSAAKVSGEPKLPDAASCANVRLSGLGQNVTKSN